MNLRMDFTPQQVNPCRSEYGSLQGKQRQSNYALLARTSEEFVHLLTDNLPARPEYFAQEVDLNRRGAAPLSELPPLAPLTAPDVLRLQKEGAVVVDTRTGRFIQRSFGP